VYEYHKQSLTSPVNACRVYLGLPAQPSESKFVEQVNVLRSAQISIALTFTY